MLDLSSSQRCSSAMWQCFTGRVVLTISKEHQKSLAQWHCVTLQKTSFNLQNNAYSCSSPIQNHSHTSVTRYAMNLLTLQCSWMNVSLKCNINIHNTRFVWEHPVQQDCKSVLPRQQYLPPYARKVLTVALISCRHMGQSCRLGAQLTHVTRCPHGRKTTPTSSSIQILHSRASLRRRTSSSSDSTAPSPAD